MTVKSGKGKEITLVDADGEEIIIGGKIPEGWKFDSTKNLLQATVAGADTYVYSGGDDLITDYASVDAIQFDTMNISITNRATVSSNVVFTTNEGTLTVKNAKTKKLL